MGYLLNIFKQTSTEGRTPVIEAPAPEPRQRGPALILDAIEAVERGEGIRDQWADVCLRLAEAQDYPSVELRPGWNVDGGAYLWKLFCGKASTTWLRDLAYPALIERQDNAPLSTE